MEIAQNLEQIYMKSEPTNFEIQNAVTAINQPQKMAEQLRKEVAHFQASV